MSQALSVGAGGWEGDRGQYLTIALYLQQYSPFNIASKAMHHYTLLFKVPTISKHSDFL